MSQNKYIQNYDYEIETIGGYRQYIDKIQQRLFMGKPQAWNFT
jgi:hypothetical protein